MKTVCIYHSIDLDGWMSAAIVKHWFNQQKVPNKQGEDCNTLNFIGYNYGQPIPDLSEYDKVIMCDVSFPKEEMSKLSDPLGRLIWIDHHKSAILENAALECKGYRDVEFSACELTWKYFFPNEEMPEIVRLLGMYDSFRHKQQWRQVVGYEGYYEISNQGNVRSIDRKVIEKNTNKIKELQGKDLSVANSKRGYRVVNLFKDNKGTIKNVHQLVAEAFIPNLDNKPCINHKDSNRLNNHVDNLEWCTYEENNLHSIEFGDRGQAVLQLDENDIFINRFESIREAEEKTGVQHSNITAVCKGKRDKAGGYKWEYAFDSPKKPQFVPQDEEQKVLEFQYGARQVITNYEEAYKYLLESFKGVIYYDYVMQYTIIDIIYENGKNIYQYLCTEAKQIYKSGFTISLPNITIPEEEYVFLCINKERFNPVNFGIDYHKDGYDGCACFHYANGVWNFSLYNDNGKVDCSQIAKQYGGGGHKGAAGFRLENTEFIELISNKSNNHETNKD
jgi:oligoribonuclease NrnB/cAMP/cGMP phosphodiesterase (DHH superfamily)